MIKYQGCNLILGVLVLFINHLAFFCNRWRQNPAWLNYDPGLQQHLLVPFYFMPVSISITNFFLWHFKLQIVKLDWWLAYKLSAPWEKTTCSIKTEKVVTKPHYRIPLRMFCFALIFHSFKHSFGGYLAELQGIQMEGF